MSEPPVTFGDWPEAASAEVVWRRALIKNDREDEDFDPDWEPDVSETVTLTPSVKGLVVYTPDESVNEGKPITAKIQDVPCKFDSLGFLVNEDGSSVRILATDDPRLSVNGWTWSVKEYPAIRFAAPSGTVLDLSDFVISPDVDITKYWVERIPELVELVGDMVGIANIQLIDDDLVITMTDETVYTMAVPVASWDNLQDKPLTFPAELPFISEGSDYLPIASNPNFKVRLSPLGLVVSNEAETLVTQMTATGFSLIGYDGTYTLPGYYGVGLIRYGEATYRFPEFDARIETLATREWVDQQLPAMTMASPGRPDFPATTTYSVGEINGAGVGTTFRSTDERDGAVAWRKMVDGTWKVVEGDTGWLYTDWWVSPPVDFHPDFVQFRRINQEVHVKVDLKGEIMGGSYTIISEDLIHSLLPESMVMSLYQPNMSWVELSGQLRLYYERHIVFSHHQDVSGVGSGVFPVSRQAQYAWPTSSELGYYQIGD